MLESLVITLREGVEAALVVGIVLSYLRKTGRLAAARTVYLGLAAGVFASLVLGGFLHRLNITELGDAYEGGLMLVASVFVATMVWWMWRTGKHMRTEIETRLSGLAQSGKDAARLGLFLFVFLMVFREGVETVLFLAAVSLQTTSALLEFTGAVIGLALAVGFGVAFFKGSLRVNLPRFFRITTVVLFAISIQLLITGVHELSEAGVLPSSPQEMRLVGPVVNNDLLFIVLVIAVCLFLVASERVDRANPARPGGAGDVPPSAPERRKALAAHRRQRFWKLSATGLALSAIVLISAEIVYARVSEAADAPVPVTIVGGELRIPIAQLKDHNLHHFVVDVGGREVRLIALLDSTDTVRAALDACAICGAQGYYKRGENVICRNCGAAIYAPTIGHGGGCNPIPFDPPYRVEGATLVISDTALEGAAGHFK
jgi:high-affinity iron transporter